MDGTGRPINVRKMNIPHGPEEKPEQGVPSSARMTNNRHWAYHYASDLATDGEVTGSGALVPNSQLDSNWNANARSRHWKADPYHTRSMSNGASPSKARDAMNNSADDFYETANVSSDQGRSFINGGSSKAHAGEDIANLFPHGFGTLDLKHRHEKRPSQAQDPGLLGAIGVAPSRDGSVPLSRHSSDSNPSPPSTMRNTRYGMGHTPSNSTNSARYASAFSQNGHQHNNSRTFRNNSRLDEEDNISAHYQRDMSIDTTQPRSLNHGPRQWQSGVNGASMRPMSTVPDNPADLHVAPFVNGRQSPTAYGTAASPQTMGSSLTPDRWNPMLAPNDSQISQEAERRSSAIAAFLQPQARMQPQAQMQSQAHMQPQAQMQPQAHMQPQVQPFYPHSQYYQTASTSSQYEPQNLFEYLRAGIVPSLTGFQMTAGAFPTGTRREEHDSSMSHRSGLLEEYRKTHKTSKKWELKHISNHIVEFSGDQFGSRFIQAKLETASSDEKDRVFKEVEPNGLQLMKDLFGNYVIQKFFAHGNQVQKKILAAQMKGKVLDLSLQTYACRVVQKALEHVLVEQQAELVRELKHEIIKVIMDQNGNHVIQKVLEVVDKSHADFIMKAVRGQAAWLATHMYACRVIQRIFDFGLPADRDELVRELFASATTLIKDQYGNYVVQHIIEHGEKEEQDQMVQVVGSDLLTFSKHKYASNVVEKCIKFGNEQSRVWMRDQFTGKDNTGQDILPGIIKDQYGNYVIQRLVDWLEDCNRQSFVDLVRPIAAANKETNTGRVVQAMDRLIATVDAPAGSRRVPSEPRPGCQRPTTQRNGHSRSPANTPALTRGQNSPQSSGAPSTNGSTIGAGCLDEDKTKSQGQKNDDVSVKDVEDGES